MPCGPLRKGAGSPDRAVRELLLTEVEADILRVTGRATKLDMGNKAFTASATPPGFPVPDPVKRENSQVAVLIRATYGYV